MSDKATRIDLLDWRTAPMRAFHLTWIAFFVCFFAWFACAPLMPLIAREFRLSADQVANVSIAAVAATIAVRLVVGPLCDRFGPRRVYAGLLALGAIPVFAVAFSHDYLTFLLCRLGIGAIGASFVITQYHTSVMFAPNVVGTANATAAGWGNAGAGAAQAAMPLLVAAALMLGLPDASAWRAALAAPGVAMLAMAFVYWRFTQDCPQGDFAALRARGARAARRSTAARRAASRASPPRARTTACGCCSSPTARASASKCSCTTSPRSTTSITSSCR